MGRKLRIRIEKEGWAATLREFGRALVPTRFEVWELSLPSDVARWHPCSEGEEGKVSLGTLKQLKSLRKEKAAFPVEFYRDIVDGIQGCVVAQVHGRLAGIAWAYDQRHPGHFLRLGPRDVELRSVYSLPEFRGQGVAKATIREACRRVAEQRWKRVYATIHIRNLASRSAFGAAGFRKIATLTRPALLGPRYLVVEGRTESWGAFLARLNPLRLLSSRSSPGAPAS